MNFKAPNVKRSIVVVGSIIFLVLLGYLSFHYARLTDFPIGDDPAIHITRIKQMSYGELLGTSYPLPLMLFKFIYQLTGIVATKLFVWVICFYLLIAGVAMTLFVGKAHGNWLVAMAAAVFFVTSRWVNDGLHMGVLAECFGWAMLFVAYYALTTQNLLFALLTTGVLAFSHPFALTIFGLTVLCYSIIVMLTGDAAVRRFIISLWGTYVVGGVLVWLLRPSMIEHFLAFTSADPTGWGERTIWEILASDDPRRLILPILALIGLPVAVSQWEKPVNKIVVILLGLGSFFSVNYIFGVNFIPFRFYVYLEMAVAILAAIGLMYIVQNITTLLSAQLALLICLTVLFSLPNRNVNEKIGHWQATNPDAKAIMTPADRQAFEWIRMNTKDGDSFAAPEHYDIWLPSAADRKTVYSYPLVYNEGLAKEFFAAGSVLELGYIYYPVGQVVPPSISRRFEKVYSKDGVSIWKVLNAFGD